MFKDTNQDALIERAYDTLGDRIAYVEKGEKALDETTVESVREEHENH
jgi:hypothetical protein